MFEINYWAYFGLFCFTIVYMVSEFKTDFLSDSTGNFTGLFYLIPCSFILGITPLYCTGCFDTYEILVFVSVLIGSIILTWASSDRRHYLNL